MVTLTRYANLSGNSSIVSYKVGPSVLTIMFKNGVEYRYSKYYLNSISQFYTMASLAKSGRGLNTYINKNKPHYISKE